MNDINRKDKAYEEAYNRFNPESDRASTEDNDNELKKMKTSTEENGNELETMKFEIETIKIQMKAVMERLCMIEE